MTTLSDRLRSDDPWVRVSAAETAGKMRSEAGDTVPLLIQMAARSEFVFSDPQLTAGQTAREALRALGPAAVPGLVDALHAPQAPVRKAAAEVLGSFDSLGEDAVAALVKCLQDRQVPVRKAAIASLGHVARGSEPAARELFNVLKADRELRDYAAEELGAFGSVAEPYLRQAAQEPDPDVRRAAMLGLGSLGGNGVFVLVQALHDPDRIVVMSALRALLNEKIDAAPAIYALVDLLQKDDNELQDAAIRVIAFLDDRAGPAVPQLINALTSSNKEIRSSACWALGRIGPTAKPAVATLAGLLGTEDYARWALLRIDLDAALVLLVDHLNQTSGDYQWRFAYDLSQHPAKALPLLMAALDHHNPNGRIGVLKALGLIGEPAEPAASSIINIFEHEQTAVRAEAVRTLVLIVSSSERIESVLSRAIRDPDVSIRLAVLETIRLKNHQGTPSAATLRECFVDPEMSIREAAAQALKELGGLSIPSLIAGLDDPRQSVREYSVLALGELGRFEKPGELHAAVPYLVLALRYRDPGMPRTRIWTHAPSESYGTIADSLRVAGPATKGEVPALVNALAHENEEVREAAAREIGRTGTDAVAATPALLRSLDDKDPGVREAAIVALGMIGANASQALPRLTEILSTGQSSDESVGSLKNSDVASLVDSFHRGDRSMRARLATLVGQMGAKGNDATVILIEGLNDYDREVREAAAKALQNLGRAAVPTLIEGLKHPSPKTRESSCVVLRSLGPDARQAVTALISTASDSNADVRSSAIDALGKIGAASKPAIPTLVAALADTSFSVRYSAQWALVGVGKPAVSALIKLLESRDDKNLGLGIEILGSMGANAAAATPVLIRLLDSGNDRVAGAAATALGAIGRPAGAATSKLIALLNHQDESFRWQIKKALEGIGDSAIPPLIRALSHSNPRVRSEAAQTLGLIGKDASAATKRLVLVASSDVEPARSNALEALGRIGPAAQPAVPIMTRLLESADDPFMSSLAKDLAAIGGAAIPLMTAWLESGDTEKRRRAIVVLAASEPGISRLIQALASTDEGVSTSAVEGLAEAGPEAVPSLIEASGDENYRVRALSLLALSKIEPRPAEAVPIVIKALRDRNAEVRHEAMDALVRFKELAVPQVAELLASEDIELRKTGCLILGHIGQAATSVVPLLRERARDSNPDVRAIAAYAILAIERDAKLAVEFLTLRLEKSWYESSLYGPDQHDKVSNAIANIAESLVDAQDTAAIPELRKALAVISTDDGAHARVSRAVASLDAIESTRKARVLASLWNTSWFPPLFLLASVYVGWLLAIRFLILIKWPLNIWKWNSALRPIAELKLPNWSAGLPIPLKYILVIGFFEYHDRVLDAWIWSRLAVARKNFHDLPTVRSRAVHVEVPVVLDGTTIIHIKAEHLRPLFKSANRTCLLIVGEGGAGKTSLACLLGRGALSDGSLIFADYPMLPILLEEDLDDPDQPAGSRRLFEAIRSKLTALVGEIEPIDPDLTLRLLKRKRLLVIIDHISELSEATRKQIRPASTDFPIGISIVTSRVDNRLGEVQKSVMKPQRIAGDRLTSFMEAYLTQRGKRELFDDQEYIGACLHLTRIVGDRDVTVLLGKMFADQLIATKEKSDGFDLPRNIPDMMLKYVSYLHQSDDDQGVIRRALADSKTVAWMCVREYFYPTRAYRSKVLEELGGVDCEDRLQHLESYLHLVTTDGIELNRIRFLLDPLAEYLAALQVIELHGGDTASWEAFLEQLNATEGTSVSKGFVLALRDCCQQKGKEYAVPGFVHLELMELLR